MSRGKARYAAARGGIEALLQRLEQVRAVGHGRWRARCPAHQGENRDVLSLAETSDGTVLVKCFAGCTAAQVVEALGLELADLFPQWIPGHARPARRPRPDWAALVGACERDLLLRKIILASIEERHPLSAEDRLAAGRAATRVYQLLQEARDG